jgi:hypothetical protein
MPPAGLEPTVAAGERPQTNALDRAATGTGERLITLQKSFVSNVYPRCCCSFSSSNSLLAGMNEGCGTVHTSEESLQSQFKKFF